MGRSPHSVGRFASAVGHPAAHRCGKAVGMRDGHLHGSLTRPATQRPMDVLAAYVAAGGSVQVTAELVGIRPSTVKRHLADLRARSGLTTEQLIYAGRAAGWLMVPALEARSAISRPPDPGLVVTVEAAGAWLETSSETARSRVGTGPVGRSTQRIGRARRAASKVRPLVDGDPGASAAAASSAGRSCWQSVA